MKSPQMPQQEQKPTSQQTLLDEYMSLKPNRAVQRLLQQNDLPSCIQLYNLLQQNVKSNTTQLRSVLYSKHANLHECSEMIDKIQEFATNVKNIQEEIDFCLKAPIVYDDWKLNAQQGYESHVSKIEELINDKKFAEALRECKKFLTQNANESGQLDADPDIYYINFLKVQIIQSLQKSLQETSLSREIIAQSIAALRAFMEISSIQDFQKYIEKPVIPASQVFINCSNLSSDGVSILELLYEKCVQNSQIEGIYPLKQDSIIEVIFKFKLLSIRHPLSKDFQSPEQKVDHLYNKIFTYFSDLLQILNEAKGKSRQSPQRKNNLYQIFNLNIQKAVAHISELFISDQKSSNKGGSSSGAGQFSLTALSFQTELYEKLLNSNEFLEVLNDFSHHFKQINRSSQFSQQNLEEIQMVNLIKNLWKDFYHQMLDIITDKVNPIKLFQIPQSAPFPEQLHKYSVTQYSKITNQMIQQYEKQLSVFFGNFTELLVKSKSTSQKKSIIDYFLSLKSKISQKCDEQIVKKQQKVRELLSQRKTLKLNIKRAEHSIKELISMYFLVQSYNIAWNHHLFSQTPLQQTLLQTASQPQHFILLTLSTKNPHNNPLLFQVINEYFNYINQPQGLSQTEYIEMWQQELDLFFGSYVGILRGKEALREEIKGLILALIKTKLEEISKQ